MASKIETFRSEGGLSQNVGTYRKGELRGIIRINEEVCEGCDTCRSVCPAGAIKGEIGETHSIDFDKCVVCGQCLMNCPFDAIEQMSFVEEVVNKLKDKETKVVAIIAPAVRVAIAEEFGAKPGTLTVGKLWAALKKAGFEVYDNNFAADQTILEEGTELVARLAAHAGLKEVPLYLWDEKIVLNVEEFKHKPLPQFTSCCPAWVRYAELNYSQLLNNISSCKSPQQMAGATAKTYGAKDVWQVSPQKMYTVGVMPCTAKIFESHRPEFNSVGKYYGDEAIRDVDAVLTTRDLAEVLRKLNIDLMSLPEDRLPKDFMWYSGGATIFGASGGVMEAAARFAFHVLSGQSPAASAAAWDFQDVRGITNPVVRASLTIPLKVEYQKIFNAKELKINVCVINGIGHNGAHLTPVVEDVLRGKSPYHFIEVMNCPGGCINGGGQPKQPMEMSFMQKILYKLAKA